MGGDSGNIPKPDSPMNSESYRESNISGDDRESENFSETQSGSESDEASESESGDTSESESKSESESESKSESGEESVHTHKFERNADERYLKSAATCEKRAEYYFLCECGEKSEETFEYGKLSPHTVVIDEGIEATCTKSGRSGGKHCSVCNKILEEQQVIPALGHDTISHDGKAATCTEAGYEAYETCSRCDYTTYTAIPALGHDYVPHNGKEATCTEAGYKTYMTCTRCDYTTYEVIPALGHDLVLHNAKAPNCTEEGYNVYEECMRCDYTTKVVISALGHNYEKGNCTRCGAVDNEFYTRDEKFIYFGAYPQTKVSDNSLIYLLNKKAGKLPTENDKNNWIGCGYSIYKKTTTCMWYKDEVVNGFKYRGVYLTEYRQYYYERDEAYQKDSGYLINSVYWFKYESIKWRILSEDGDKAFVMCDLVIDIQQYNTNYNCYYKDSMIRKWLSNNFYNTAFSDMQKAIIKTVSVDNSAVSTNPHEDPAKWTYGENEGACENTNDKIFLLSESEVTNTEYGFDRDTKIDKYRQLKSSDYAKCQGAYVCADKSYKGNSFWWLRSPDSDYSCNVRIVGDNGDSGHSDNLLYCLCGGVVPALWITL